jgi:hypothetical protein
MKKFVKGVLEEVDNFRSAFNQQLSIENPDCFGNYQWVQKVSNEKCSICQNRIKCREDEKFMRTRTYLTPRT